MQFNKTKFTKLESRKSIFLQTGFVVALAIVLFAFEWKTPYSQDDDWLAMGIPIDLFEEDVVVTRPKEPKPIPKPKVTEIKIVKDTEKGDDATIDNVDVTPEDEVGFPIPVPPVEEPEPEIREDIPLKIPQVMPEFPGGYLELQKFLASNIQYPKIAKMTETEGTVFLRFIVEKDGSISNVGILRGIGNGCDEEAIRVVREMPKWRPGKQMDIPVRVEFNLPVKFTLLN